MRRFPGGAPSLSPVADLPNRDRVVIAACVVLLTALAWAYLIHLDRQMSASMEFAKPWTAADAFFTFAM